MTIERARNYFGLFTSHRAMKPGTTCEINDIPSILRDEITSKRVEVLTPDVICVENSTVLLRDRFGMIRYKHLRPRKVVLIGEEINMADVHGSIFPGVKEKIIWRK